MVTFLNDNLTCLEFPLVQKYFGGGLLSTEQYNVTALILSPDEVLGCCVIDGPSENFGMI